MPGVTVLGNVSVDRVDGRPPTPGGCPTFAGHGLAEGRIVARVAAADEALFADVFAGAGVPVTIVPGASTSRFELIYHGEERDMIVDELGDAWTAREVEDAAIETPWVHVAPLLRSDFPVETIRRLAAGHLVSYDGQGLVRAARLGPLAVDDAFDPALLGSLAVLKLADDEAAIVAGGAFDAETAKRLGVPEILVTLGSDGCDVYVDGHPERVPASPRVMGVHTTGAGDVFSVAYVAERARDTPPVDAAARASELVSRMLEARL